MGLGPWRHLFDRLVFLSYALFMDIRFSLAIFENYTKCDSLFSKNGSTRWPNKHWEIEVYNLGWGDLLDFEFSWSRKCDHAGFSLKLGLLGYTFEGKFYDSRHWDDETNNYVVYDKAYMDRHFTPQPAADTSALSYADKATAVEEFLKSDQGQRLIDKRVAEKLEEQKQAKLDKTARGEAYRRANMSGVQDV